MTKASENIFPQVRFSEEATLPTPSTDEYLIGVKDDGKAYLKNDAGTETDLTASGGGGGGDSELVLIEEVTLASAGTITFSSIPSTYRDLVIRGRVRHASATPSVATVAIRVGATTVDSGSNYRYYIRYNNLGSSGDNDVSSDSNTQLSCALSIPSDGGAGRFGIVEVVVNDYTNTSTPRLVLARSTGSAAAGSQTFYSSEGGGSWENTADAIDIVTFGAEGAMGDFAVGSALALYGVGIP